MTRRKLIIFLLTVPLLCKAQDRLSLQDAITIALKNNYSIHISKNDMAIVANDNSTGNAGMLPSVTASGGISKTENDLNQDYADGRIVDRSSVGSTSANAGVSLGWTLFDGLKMFVAKNKLEEIEARGSLSYKIQIENTVAQVVAAYCDVVQQQKLIEALDIIISIDSERVAIAQTRLQVGSGSRLEFLQAKVDLNEQHSARMKQLTTLADSRDQLNYLLSRNPGTDFSATDSILITYKPSADSLRISVNRNNYSILSARLDEKISLLSFREAKAQRAPVIDFIAGYNYSRNKNEAGFLLLNQSLGFNYGLGIQWNLFDGLNVSRQSRNAKLEYESSGFRLKDLQLKVNAQLEKALRDFENNLDILALEEENILLAEENLEVAYERFRSGLSNSLELKDARLSFQNAESRLIRVQYAAKISETELMRLNGVLVMNK